MRISKDRSIYVVLFVTLIVIFTGCSSSSNKSGNLSGSSVIPIASKGSSQNASAINLTGVFTYLDANGMKMHFVDIDSGSEYEVSYNGGTDIKNKYSNIIAASQMAIGDIYDVKCNKTGKALTIYEASGVWENTGITNFGVNEASQLMTIGTTNYKYTNNTVILSNGARIKANEIMAQDVVTVRGKNNTVYSVTVDKGHGYLKFTGVKAFLGGYVDIGTKMVLPVSENMIVTAPEGDFKITMQLGNLQGSKTISIQRDKDVTVDFSEYVPEVVKTGIILFSVTPTNAVLYLDGTQIDYSKELQLNYGKHTVVLKANNYTTYTETFIVKQDYEKRVIDMASSSASTTKSTSSSSSSTSSTAADLTAGYVVNIKEPVGAAVYVDSIYVGIVPVSFAKSSGNKVISFSKAGSATKSYTISIANANGDLNYSFPEMEAESGTSSATQ